jgi:hypothetical protein
MIKLLISVDAGAAIPPALRPVATDTQSFFGRRQSVQQNPLPIGSDLAGVLEGPLPRRALLHA